MTYIWTDDSSHDRGRDDDPTNAEPCDDERTPDLVQVIESSDRESTTSCKIVSFLHWDLLL